MFSRTKLDSTTLFLVSKLFLTSGACLAGAGVILASSHAAPFLSVGILGILVIAGGLFLRRKAILFRRRFEWRDGHVPA